MRAHNKYTATKEEARRLLAMLCDAVPIELPHLKEDLLVFLQACEKRLPAVNAVNREVERKRKCQPKTPTVRADHE